MSDTTTAVEYGVRWTDEDGQPVEPIGADRTRAEQVARLHAAAEVVACTVTTSRTPWRPACGAQRAAGAA